MGVPGIVKAKVHATQDKQMVHTLSDDPGINFTNTVPWSKKDDHYPLGKGPDSVHEES